MEPIALASSWTPTSRSWVPKSIITILTTLSSSSLISQSRRVSITPPNLVTSSIKSIGSSSTTINATNAVNDESNDVITWYKSKPTANVNALINVINDAHDVKYDVLEYGTISCWSAIIIIAIITTIIESHTTTTAK